MNPRFKLGDAVKVRSYLLFTGGLRGVIIEKNIVKCSPVYRVKLENGRERDFWPECLERGNDHDT